MATKPEPQPGMHPQQVRITCGNHIGPLVQRQFEGFYLLRVSLIGSGSELVMPQICLYLSAEMITTLSPFFRQTVIGSCWTASRSAPKRFRAAETVRVFMFLITSSKDDRRLASRRVQ